MKVRTILSGILWAIGGYAAYCVVVLIGVCVWGVESVGVERAILALWPGMDRGATRLVAAILGACLALLLVLGTGAAKELFTEYKQEQRALRWQAKKFRRQEWAARLRDVNKNTPRRDLEDVYRDGVELRDQSATRRGCSKLRDDREQLEALRLSTEGNIKRLDDHENFNKALELLEKAIREHDGSEIL